MTGTEQLAALERDVDRRRVAMPVDVADALDELVALESVGKRVVLLNKWANAYPHATSQLLRVIARDPNTSLELAPTVLANELIGGEDGNDVLVAAFPSLVGALREAAADRIGERVGLEEDPRTTVRAPDPSWLWPVGKPFPPADTVEGVQARLNYLELGAGPVDGEWTDLTRRAFVRWQVLNGFEPTGELDPICTEDLGVATPDAPE